ncbi:YiiX/YebB-like N1pC/P60 family cysteine hydrolase [Comamonas sp. AG1104]|uniref:YiiX/YebB-like N1pC/P60 family cysteine hydrolase n=1 Tax=Comamonas sp. AG1104 TaxID=2183900 RepID=UPI001F3A4FBE|nr:YiiX/YebB-like N1pC/P60 family cysteine hydrolase [Comamonas sp. AG1104]
MLPLPPQAAPGDLIFRRGTENVSHLVQAVDHGDFSHVGMLVGRPGQWQVLHATPSERPGQADAVVLDSLDFFLDAQRAQAYRLYQVASDPGTRERAVAWAMAQQGQPFQLLGSGKGIYCTTLVWQAWLQSGADLEVVFTEVELPILGGRYLLPSSLLRSSRLRALTPLLPTR